MSLANTKTTMETSEKALYPLKSAQVDWLKSRIRDVPDFPKPGIIFKDLTTLLNDAAAFQLVVNALTEKCRELKVDHIAGIEARGFIFAAACAYNLNIGFVPIRKPGKLPHIVESASYELEYGSNTVEIHKDAVENGKRVVLLDDLLATGGTAEAGYQLLKKIGAEVVGIGFVVELGFLGGRQKLPGGVDTFALINYE